MVAQAEKKKTKQ